MSASRISDAADERKGMPMARGLLDYFPLALAEVARTSLLATQQHHPDKEMHWDRAKSSDHADCIVRHLIDRGRRDARGIRHSAKVAWRALAMLQLEMEAAYTGEAVIDPWRSDCPECNPLPEVGNPTASPQPSRVDVEMGVDVKTLRKAAAQAELLDCAGPIIGVTRTYDRFGHTKV